MALIGEKYSIGDTLTFYAQTQGTGGPTDADSLPTYRIYEEATGTAILTGSFALFDSSNTDGLYYAQVTLSAANGFEYGKTYLIRKYGLVSTQPGAIIETFRITSAGATSISALSGWPTADDVTLRLTEMRLTAPSDDTINAAINAAVEAWEGATGFEPFLGTGVDETRYLSGEGYLIDFQGGITAAPTTLIINGRYDNDGVYQAGTTLVVNRDYKLMPLNALARGKPYTYCKVINQYPYMVPRPGFMNPEIPDVKIVAPFGYSETVPADVWEAILRGVLAALMVTQTISLSGGMESWTEADVKESWGKNSPLSTATDYYEQKESALVMRYKRVRVS